MSESPEITSEYWGLHRNSLLASGALFLSCFAPPSSTLSIFGINFEKLNILSLQYMLVVLAIYCWIALYVEWCNGPKKKYRKIKGQHADLMNFLALQANDFYILVNQLKKQMESYKSDFLVVSSQNPFYPFKDQNDIYTDVFEPKLRELRINPVDTGSVNDGEREGTEKFDISGIVSLHIENFARSSAVDLINTANSRLSLTTSAMDEHFSELNKRLSIFVDNFENQFPGLVGKAEDRLRWDRSDACISLVYLGICWPTAAGVIALLSLTYKYL